MREELIEAYRDLPISAKRNEIVNLIMKMDLLLEQVNKEKSLHREVSNYVYKSEDEDDYLVELYRNVYNLTENLTDYLYFLSEENSK